MARSRTGSVTTAATRALDRAGVVYEVCPYGHDGRSDGYGAEAAAALGVSADVVLKTLVVRLDGAGFAVVCLPVAAQADLKAVAAAVGAKRAALADPKDVQRLTGYVLGGVSPFGQRTSLPTIVEVSVREHERIYVSGGRRGLDVAIAPADLAGITQATWAPVTR